MAHISSGQFEILNPSLNELNLDGLSIEERTRILEVIKKEKVATHFFSPFYHVSSPEKGTEKGPPNCKLPRNEN